ncbi:MAG TPA: hypothetical protein VIV60_00095, partial [Polyangiaceae bacterium]
FYMTNTRSVQSGDLTLFVDGPRVSAPAVGGASYHYLLCESVDDSAAMSIHRQLTEASGLDWGTVTYGLARGDTSAAAWFCPPRPPTLDHFRQLYEVFQRGVASEQRNAAQSDPTHLADWHWQFVRLHPFRCANQSLSMNIVNAMLAHSKRSTVPHLLLDQCALRLTREAYRRVFSRATRYWGNSAASATERWKALADKRAVLDRFVNELTLCGDVAAARAYAEHNQDAAQLALLVD